uniref:Uncharacterized protein n=1 Tax=viral metagenome TaxID=1070528 RepID=A0A6C0AE36_9ZZZZ
MDLIKIKKKKLPGFIKNSDFFRDNSDNEYVYIPKLFLVKNDKVTNILEYKKLFPVIKYFMLEFPESMTKFQKENEDAVLEFLLPNRDQDEEKKQIEKIKKNIIKNYNEKYVFFEIEDLKITSQGFFYKLFMNLKDYGQIIKIYLENQDSDNFEKFYSYLTIDGRYIKAGSTKNIQFENFLIKMEEPFNNGVTFELNEIKNHIKNLTIFLNTEEYEELYNSVESIYYFLREFRKIYKKFNETDFLLYFSDKNDNFSVHGRINNKKFINMNVEEFLEKYQDLIIKKLGQKYEDLDDFIKAMVKKKSYLEIF